MDYMVMSLTNPHTIRDRPALKDVERGFSSFFIQLFRKRLSEKVHATIPRGIVGGFEITVLHRNFERMAREAMDYVSEC